MLEPGAMSPLAALQMKQEFFIVTDIVVDLFSPEKQ